MEGCTTGGFRASKPPSPLIRAFKKLSLTSLIDPSSLQLEASGSAAPYSKQRCRVESILLSAEGRRHHLRRSLAPCPFGEKSSWRISGRLLKKVRRVLFLFKKFSKIFVYNVKQLLFYVNRKVLFSLHSWQAMRHQRPRASKEHCLG